MVQPQLALRLRFVFRSQKAHINIIIKLKKLNSSYLWTHKFKDNLIVISRALLGDAAGQYLFLLVSRCDAAQVVLITILFK